MLTLASYACEWVVHANRLYRCHKYALAHLKERMTHRGVPLDGDGQGEEDGAGEADVGQGQEEWDQVEEEGCLLDQGDHLGQTEQDDGNDKVQEVIAYKAQQELVEVFLEHFSAEQEDGEAVANNSNAADTNLEKKNTSFAQNQIK